MIAVGNIGDLKKLNTQVLIMIPGQGNAEDK